MAETFDPYRRWLGIPPEEQPPHLYRLLGIGLFESDPDVIEGGADRQMAHLQKHQTGKHSALTQKLLNELATAKLRLLDSEKKAVYDKRLKQRIAAKQLKVPTATAVPRRTKSVSAGKPATAPDKADSTIVVVAPKIRQHKRGPNWPVYALLGGLAAAFIAAIVVLGNLLSEESVVQSGGSNPSVLQPKKSRQEEPDPVRTTKPSLQLSDRNTSEKPTSLVQPQDPELPESIAVPSVGAPVDIPVPERPPVEETPATENVPLESPAVPSVNRSRSPFRGRVDLSDLLDQPGTDSRDVIKETGAKVAPPSQEEEDQASQLVREVFQAQFDNANSPALQISLAEQLYEKAVEGADESSTRFVLLRDARDLASAAGSAESALRMIDSLGSLFTIDTTRMKADVLEKMAGSVRSSTAHRSIAIHALALVEPAVAVNDFRLAQELAETGNASANRAHDGNLIKVAHAIADELPKLEEKHRQFEAALAALQGAPDDPQANLIAGSYYCFVMDNWSAGLPLLAKSDDGPLRSVAAMDLVQPAGAIEQLATANAWWELIEGADEMSQPGIQDRAAYWYRTSHDGLDGLKRKLVAQRLDVLDGATGGESQDETPKFVDEFVGKYVLQATSKKLKQTKLSILEFKRNHAVNENDLELGRWELLGANRLRVSFADAQDPPVFFKPRLSRGSINTTRKVQGDSWRWELSRLSVVATWEHTTDELRIGGRRLPGSTEILTFYSNGGLNDPLGTVTWTRHRRNLAIDWGNGKTTVAVLDASNSAYAGKTTSPTGIGNLTINMIVRGRLLDPAGNAD